MKPLVFITVLILSWSCNNNPPAPSITVQPTHKDSAVIRKETNKLAITKNDTIPLPPEHYTRKGPEIGFDLCDSEKVGSLFLGLPGGQLVMIIGIPNKKGDTIRMGADGLIHQDWIYKKDGIWLDMAGENMATLRISGLMIYAPCTFKTKRGIGIGNTIQDIRKAYPRAIKISSETMPRMMILGSAYGGIQFTIDNSKVDTLFIGATAE